MTLTGLSSRCYHHLRKHLERLPQRTGDSAGAAEQDICPRVSILNRPVDKQAAKGVMIVRFLIGFLLGFMIGASVALALAPEPGATTRAKVIERMRERRGSPAEEMREEFE